MTQLPTHATQLASTNRPIPHPLPDDDLNDENKFERYCQREGADEIAEQSLEHIDGETLFLKSAVDKRPRYKINGVPQRCWKLKFLVPVL